VIHLLIGVTPLGEREIDRTERERETERKRETRETPLQGAEEIFLSSGENNKEHSGTGDT
jgi:hypothetical protein